MTFPWRRTNLLPDLVHSSFCQTEIGQARHNGVRKGPSTHSNEGSTEKTEPEQTMMTVLCQAVLSLPVGTNSEVAIRHNDELTGREIATFLVLLC